MAHHPSSQPKQAPQAHALGNYRHDVAYTAALKSVQALALGSYRHDVAYAAALKSEQQHALGNYRNDVAYAAALKSGSVSSFATQGVIGFGAEIQDFLSTGAEHGLAPVIFWDESRVFGVSGVAA